MGTVPNFSTATYTVPANGVYSVAASGNYIENLTQVTVAGSLTVSIQGGRGCRFDAGDTYIMDGTDTFEGFLLTNTTGQNINVQVGIAQGQIKVANAVSVQGTAPVTITSGTTLVDVADVAVAAGTAVKVIAGTGTDKSKIISNLLSNNTVVRVGTTDVAAAQGAEIPIGGSITLDTSADVWVYNPSAGGIYIGVLVTRA
jgi:hypothetical protein